MTLRVPYVYRGTVARVVDGDTFVCDVDFGMYRHEVDVPIRLLHCAAREISAPGGKEARDNLARILPPGSVVLLQTAKPDKFARRWDAQVTYERDGVIRDLATDLIADGWAAAWDGRGTQPKPAWPRPASAS
jgi:endonuclease YncB( thermonuclease family)